MVRIGNSPLAPIFDVLERPSNWDRQIRELASKSGSPLSQFRQEFWTFYAQPHKDDGTNPNLKASNQWIKVDDSRPTISLGLGSDAVAIFFTTVGTDSLEELLTWIEKHSIRDRLGVETEYCYQDERFDTHDRANWEEMADWLHIKLHQYREALLSTSAD